MLLLFLFAWWLLGFIAAGFLYAHMCHEFPFDGSREDLGMATFLGFVFGPFALLMSFFLTGFWEHGWRLKPPKEEE